MKQKSRTDYELINCGHCNKPVETAWAYNDDDQCLGLELGAYQLWGDSILCLPCTVILDNELEKLNAAEE